MIRIPHAIPTRLLSVLGQRQHVGKRLAWIGPEAEPHFSPLSTYTAILSVAADRRYSLMYWRMANCSPAQAVVFEQQTNTGMACVRRLSTDLVGADIGGDILAMNADSRSGLIQRANRYCEYEP